MRQKEVELATAASERWARAQERKLKIGPMFAERLAFAAGYAAARRDAKREKRK